MELVFKKSVIALSIALAITACQNLEQDKKQADKEAKKDRDYIELLVTEEKSAASKKEINTSVDELLAEIREQDVLQSQVNKQRESEFTTSPILRRPANEPPQQSMVVTSGSRLKRIGISAAAPVILSDGGNSMPEFEDENYSAPKENGVKLVKEQPVSTFSIDVDTASYANVRRMLNDGYLPPKEAVRLEEFVNYFDYDFKSPKNKEQPFSIATSTMQAPWNHDAHLIQIGIKGYEPKQQALPPSNLVFLVDVSGSMNRPNKLGLVKKSLRLLTQQLTKKDKVSLVVYAGASGVVLEPTSGDNKLEIEQALERLSAGGSTNGASGIQLAYQMAQKGFIKDGINRVILATDGDFNVGMTDHDALISLIESKRKTNIFFSSLGFGSGNYNDHLMEQLANKGNGNAAYIDSLHEAKKVLVDERAGTLMTIAKDVKIQVEFNPQIVSEYRLLGYENRLLKREDFNNDKVDAGEIGAGHTVTALYEVVLKGSEGKRVDPLRYQKQEKPLDTSDRKLAYEAAMVKVRYKLPDENNSRLIADPIYANTFGKEIANQNIQFAAASAGFAQLLKGNNYMGDWGWDDAIESAKAAKGNDPKGYRAEMIKLMELAQLMDKTNEVEQRVGMVKSKSQ